MTSDHILRSVLDEFAEPARKQQPDWADVLRRGRASARTGATRPRRRLLLAAALTVLTTAAVGVALAATGVLQGPPAPPENDAALRHLMPPLGIGPATELASHNGRTLFGARTKAGGYCFSATSPTDPRGEGGHCLSDADAARLDNRHVVAFALSGSSAGGYAPGADSVHVTGAGIDAEFPVAANGWWIGEARLPTPPLAPGVESATVVATAGAKDGSVVGRDSLLFIERAEGLAGDVYRIAFR